MSAAETTTAVSTGKITQVLALYCYILLVAVRVKSKYVPYAVKIYKERWSHERQVKITVGGLVLKHM